MRRSLLRLSIPLREPFVTSGGVVSARELAVIRLEDDDGAVGFGEAAPLEPYDGVTVDEVVEALRDGPPGAARRRRPEPPGSLQSSTYRCAAPTVRSPSRGRTRSR